MRRTRIPVLSHLAICFAVFSIHSIGGSSCEKISKYELSPVSWVPPWAITTSDPIRRRPKFPSDNLEDDKSFQTRSVSSSGASGYSKARSPPAGRESAQSASSIRAGARRAAAAERSLTNSPTESALAKAKALRQEIHSSPSRQTSLNSNPSPKTVTANPISSAPLEGKGSGTNSPNDPRSRASGSSANVHVSPTLWRKPPKHLE